MTFGHRDPHSPSHIHHVDVAILYGLGLKDRAQHIARELRPSGASRSDDWDLSPGVAIEQVPGDIERDSPGSDPFSGPPWEPDHVEEQP